MSVHNKTYSNYNTRVFSDHASMFDVDYWRRDEEEAILFLATGKVLISGVGGGRTIPYIREKGFVDITAVDISPEMVKICQRRFPDLAVSVADLQKTNFPSETFDSIFLPFHTIAYVDDLDETLREMHRILKPGGKFVFSIPNHFRIQSLRNGSILKGKRRSTEISRGNTSTLSTLHLSMCDVRRIRKIFSSVDVRGRVSLQHLEHPNWKDRVLMLLPFFDKSLYFFCTK